MKQVQEIIDIYNEQMEKIGTMEVRQAHKKNQWHKTAHIWITDGQNVLVQIFSPDNKEFPNRFDHSAGGHIRTGETVLQGAKREYEEELGLAWAFNNLKENCIIKTQADITRPRSYEFCHLFFVSSKIDLTKRNLQKSEAYDFKFIPYKEFVKIFNDKHFFPYSKEYRETVIKGLEKLITK